MTGTPRRAWPGKPPEFTDYPTLDRDQATAAARRLMALRGEGAPVSDNRLLTIERFCRMEARLLDDEAYPAWLDLLADDLYYWMPVRHNRYRADAAGEIDVNGMAFFDDRKRDIVQRIARIASAKVWGEDPPTRHVYIIGNVEAFETDIPGEHEVQSTFIQTRSRGEHDETTLIGRRRDILRAAGDSYQIVGRLILVSQSTLLSKNLSAFF